jgi:hypothetical protein
VVLVAWLPDRPDAVAEHPGAVADLADGALQELLAVDGQGDRPGEPVTRSMSW